MQRQSSSPMRSTTSKMAKVDPPSKAKVKADRKRNSKGVLPLSAIDRASPYFRITNRAGSKQIIGPRLSVCSTIHNVPSGAERMVPSREARTLPSAEVNNATTFVDSVISLCSKSIASCCEIGEPAPSEDMFLLLVRQCGLTEAKSWAELMGLPHARSLRLLQELSYSNSIEPQPTAL